MMDDADFVSELLERAERARRLPEVPALDAAECWDCGEALVGVRRRYGLCVPCAEERERRGFSSCINLPKR